MSHITKLLGSITKLPDTIMDAPASYIGAPEINGTIGNSVVDRILEVFMDPPFMQWFVNMFL